MWVRDCIAGLKSLKVHHTVSDINVEGPPVPIPNTEVKLNCAEDTRMEASRENRSTPTSFLSYSSLAQSVERMTVNHDVAGSSPAGGANKEAECKSTPFSFFVSRIVQTRRVLLCKTLHGCVADVVSVQQGEPKSDRNSGRIFLLFTTPSAVWYNNENKCFSDKGD